MQDAKGNTALHIAATSGNAGACRSLLMAGANLTIRNNKGKKANQSLSGISSYTIRRLFMSEFELELLVEWRPNKHYRYVPVYREAMRTLVMLAKAQNQSS